MTLPIAEAIAHEKSTQGKNAKVLIVSLHHPELMRGGAQQVCYELFQGLKQDPGIEPILLASTDAAYPALYKSGACITGFDGRNNEFLFLSTEYDTLWHKAGSPRLIEAFADFLETIQPDVVHFHHFLTFGVNLLALARKVLPNAKLVFTFHEFLGICDARGHMVRLTDHSLCSHASPVRCHQCFPERSPEHFLMRQIWFKRHFDEVDVFTCPSQFMIDRYAAWGIDRKKLLHIANGQADCSRGIKLPVPAGPKRRFGFFGQMIDVKGIQIILRAVALLRAQGFTNFTVELNGDNLRYATPIVREEIETFLAEEEKLPYAQRIVQNNGSYQVDQLASRMARIDWSIVPSLWEEAFGLVVSEAWMFRRPVICSNVGGLAERVTNEVNGLHFQIGDPHALAAVMQRACTEADLWERLSAAIPQPPSVTKMVSEYRGAYGLADETPSGLPDH
ncbi:MAG TPA: glycosyltransferase [Candidatus Sulfotelmatobacter sp.]|nr:glycosyltransferase [Candidatus Sulfotelmatobacter sp.]